MMNLYGPSVDLAGPGVNPVGPGVNLALGNRYSRVWDTQGENEMMAQHRSDLPVRLKEYRRDLRGGQVKALPQQTLLLMMVLLIAAACPAGRGQGHQHRLSHTAWLPLEVVCCIGPAAVPPGIHQSGLGHGEGWISR